MLFLWIFCFWEISSGFLYVGGESGRDDGVGAREGFENLFRGFLCVLGRLRV